MLTKSILKDFSYLTIGRILRILISLATGVYILNRIGAENFSIFQFLVLSFSIVAVFIDFGSNEIVQKQISDNVDEQHIATNTLLFKFINFLFIFPIWYLILKWFNYNNATSEHFFYYVPLLLFSSLNFGTYFLKYHLHTKKIAIIEMTSIAISSLLKVIVVTMTSSLNYFLLVSTVESLINMVLHNSSYLSLLKARLFNLKDLLKLYSVGFYAFLSNLLLVIEKSLPVLLLYPVLEKQSYSELLVAIGILEYFTIFAIPLSNAIFPLMLKDREKSAKYFFIFPVSGLFVAIALNLFGCFLLSKMLSDNYENSLNLLRLLSWSLVYQFTRIYLYRLFFSKNKTPLFFIFTLLSSATVVIITLLSDNSQRAFIIASIFVPLISFILFTIASRNFRLIFKNVD